MATIDLYIDIFEKKLVAGLTDPTARTLPRLTQGDSPTMRIWLLQPVAGSSLTTPYTYVLTSGVTLQAAVGARVGNATTYYTQQFTWTASTDVSNPYFTAALPMNTQAITTLLGANGSASAYFEVKMFVSGVPTTVFSDAVTIQAAVIKDGGTIAPPIGTPISAETASATFLGREVVGPITLVCSTDTTKKIQIYVSDDGAFHADPVT